MILAAAACAEGNGPPPPELELAWQARTWGIPPEPGGLRDQRAGELRKMTAALNTYNAFRAWRQATDWAQWAQRNPEDWQLVQYVLTLRERDAGRL